MYQAFYNIAKKKYRITSMDERREIFRVYIELCKHGSQPVSVQNPQMLYYKYLQSIILQSAYKDEG